MLLPEPIERCVLAEAEGEERARVVAAARSWIGTAYHHNAAAKKNGDDLGGVDCGRIIIEVFAEAGLLTRFDPGYYTNDWHCHRDEERYMETLARYLPPVDADNTPLNQRGENFRPQPGDVLMWRIGRTFSHAAIVTDWPLVVHSSAGDRIVLEVSVRGTPVENRLMRHFSYWNC